ncbi:hypothetical protein RND81_02G170700 [Saponaria officinalis]|uniref:Uncharacterized protein n=1 Tax=Saponaria officinalis TaxID=3572 RepID=A0AAW1MN88_SAPOF
MEFNFQNVKYIYILFTYMSFSFSLYQVKTMKFKSTKQVSMSNRIDISVYMDEDEALKQATTLSLNDVGEISDLQHGGSSRNSHALTASEVGKGNITLRDVERMVATHDFT